jgi:hypothetical protein
MLADNVRMDRVRIDVNSLPNHLSETRRVQHRASADDPGRRQTGRLGEALGKDVDRIATSASAISSIDAVRTEAGG